MKTEQFRMEHVSLCSRSGIVLNDLNLAVMAQEIHCLFCSSNRARAGLFELLSGAAAPQAGKIFLCGRDVSASLKGQHATPPIAYLREETELFPELTVAENLLGTHPDLYAAGYLSEIRMFAWAKSILSHYAVSKIRVDRRLSELSLIQQRLISIIRALSLGAKVLFIEDSLTLYNAGEIREYISFIQRIAAESVSVVLVTDRFNEFVTCAEYISVIRSWTIIYHASVASLTQHELVKLVKSREVRPEPLPQRRANETPVFTIRDSLHRVRSISLYPSEILGIYDPDWHVGAVIRQVISSYILDSSLAQADIAVITEEDCTDGVFKNMNLYENISLCSGAVFDKPLGMYNIRMEYYMVKYVLDRLDAGDLFAKYAGLETLPQLSPSEQMTVVTARHLCAAAKAFVFINPYTGFNDRDITKFVNTLNKLKEDGYPIMVLSKNEPQLKKLCNRIDDFS